MNLLIKLKESTFYTYKVSYFKYIIILKRIRINFKKIATIKDWQVPINIKEVQAFLKLANYYRKFILRFEHIASLLTDLTKKK